MFEQKQELYKVSQSTGKTQVWSGWTEDEKVFCSWGDIGGKMQIKEYSASGKNQGRSNETSDNMQAVIELVAMYKAQIDNKHYKLSQQEAMSASEVCLEPRKVQNYKDHSHKLPNTCISTVKYNGSRACIIDGVLRSKIGRVENINVPHIKNAVEVLNDLDLANMDCEVYAHGLPLQRIRSAWLKPSKTNKEIIKIANERAKKVGDIVKFSNCISAVEYLGYNPNEDAPKLKLFVFDIPVMDKTEYNIRLEAVKDLQHKLDELNLNNSIEIVESFTTHSTAERLQLRDKYTTLGYEGLVHGDPLGVYEFGKRSSNTQKDKPRYDGESLVIDVTSDKNGEGLLHCRSSDSLDNVTFKCKMKVERRDGKRYERDYETMRGLIGKWITFSYEELSEAGVPTKPVAEEERNCNSAGEPQE
ncbi:DNA ligase [Shewanella sp. phage 1/4]|uniref:ATP-dependent DNA ligase n=1 Tax=Shewanella phage 1/4 TaxID=1458859 RepID=UPI0004F7DC90|nr:ATP-dependent DNA ligase [Shewanella sp. phage 1/4]AHK11133.1 DNA ligase [Shewanella sp. phage 1/4]